MTHEERLEEIRQHVEEFHREMDKIRESITHQGRYSDMTIPRPASKPKPFEVERE